MTAAAGAAGCTGCEANRRGLRPAGGARAMKASSDTPSVSAPPASADSRPAAAAAAANLACACAGSPLPQRRRLASARSAGASASPRAPLRRRARTSLAWRRATLQRAGSPWTESPPTLLPRGSAQTGAPATAAGAGAQPRRGRPRVRARAECPCLDADLRSSNVVRVPCAGGIVMRLSRGQGERGGRTAAHGL